MIPKLLKLSYQFNKIITRVSDVICNSQMSTATFTVYFVNFKLDNMFL